jgi:transcriptional regulator with XRE-family HTH domain
MIEFGEMLSVSQGMVSRYECGRNIPSVGVILRLYKLAETDFEKSAISAVMGADQDAFQQRARDVLEDLQAELRKRNSSPETRKLFMELATEAARQTEVPSALLRLFQAWRRYRHIPEVRNELNEAATRIEKLGEEMVNPARPAIRPPAGEETQYNVMIRCPQTRKPVNTNWTIDRVSWKALEIERQRVFCPHCHGYHDWTKADAYLRKAS